MAKILLISRTSNPMMVAHIREGEHDPTEVMSFTEGLKEASQLPHDSIIVVEYKNTDGDAHEFLKNLEMNKIKRRVIIHHEPHQVQEAYRAGKHKLCFDVLQTASLDQTILESIENNLPGLRDRKLMPRMMFQQDGDAAKELRENVEAIGPLEINVAILGGPGQGKERVAQTIHELSQRATMPIRFIRHDDYVTNYECRNGCSKCYLEEYFEKAEGGTLVLLDLPRYCKRGQACLSSNLNNPRNNVRIIVTGCREEIEEAVEGGNFDRILWHKLSEGKIVMPNLSDCPTNIAWLSRHMVESLRRDFQFPKLIITDNAIMVLQSLKYKGNVMELYSILSQTAIKCKNGIMDEKDLIHLVKKDPEIKGESEKKRILRIRRSSPNMKIAAIRFGTCLRTLYNKMSSHGINPGIACQ